MNPDLFLYEEILLLVLKDKEGTFTFGTMYYYALGGAIIAELLLLKKIQVETEKKKKVSILNDTLTGDEILDEGLMKIREAKRPKDIQTWVTELSALKDLTHRIARRLCVKGVLRAEESKVLFLFTQKRYPEVNHEPENNILQRLEHAIVSDDVNVEPKTIILLSLAKTAELLPYHFNKNLLKDRKERIERLVNGEITGQVTQDIIQAMQAALLITCIIPTMMVITSN